MPNSPEGKKQPFSLETNLILEKAQTYLGVIKKNSQTEEVSFYWMLPREVSTKDTVIARAQTISAGAQPILTQAEFDQNFSGANNLDPTQLVEQLTTKKVINFAIRNTQKVGKEALPFPQIQFSLAD